jgi:hypothetical protein
LLPESVVVFLRWCGVHGAPMFAYVASREDKVENSLTLLAIDFSSQQRSVIIKRKSQLPKPALMAAFGTLKSIDWNNWKKSTAAVFLADRIRLHEEPLQAISVC